MAVVANNHTKTRQSYAQKLTRLGLPTPVKDIVNSSQVLVSYLLTQAPGCGVFPISEQPLRDELTAAGFVLCEAPEKINYVIASFDRTFCYHKLQVAFDALRAGAHFIATNGDAYCPVPGGGEPDAAAIIAAVEACTGHKVELIAGKPSPLMVQTALSVLGVAPHNSIMTGDRIETDILMGHRAGMCTALPLTGATTREKLERSEIQPDYVLEQLDQLLPILPDVC